MKKRRRFGIATAQASAALALLLVLALRPPAVGPMLVVPLGPSTEAALVNATLAQGGFLLGAGPLRGSLIVYGARAALEPALWGRRAVLLVAPAFACRGASAPAGKGLTA